MHRPRVRARGRWGTFAYAREGDTERTGQGDYVCWAVFGGTGLNAASIEAIACNDPDLIRIASLWGLTIHGY